MAEESAQEKTEEPTARKLQKAREDGQVARSQELPGAAVMIGAVTTMVLMGGWLITSLTAVFKAGFVFDNKTLLSPDLLPLTFGSQAVQAYLVVVPVFIVTIVLAILASGATGGYLFSLKSIAPKASKINPLEGFKRMFGIKALVELTKALLMRVSVGVNMRPCGNSPTPLPKPPKKLSNELNTTVGSITTMVYPRSGLARIMLTDNGALSIFR